MAFEKVFKSGEDFTPLKEKYDEDLNFLIDSDTLKVLNRDAYRMFVGKLIGFNNKYAPKIDRSTRENEEAYKQNRFVNTKYPIDIDWFFRINHRWRSIAMKYFARIEDPSGLEKIKEFRPEDQFPRLYVDLLKESTKEVCFQLSGVVEEMKLGTPYTNKQGETELDYTEISRELMELTLLATHAYTDVFNILEKEYGSNALDKMQDLTESMHPLTYYDQGSNLPRRSLSMDGASWDLIRNPLSVKNSFFGYTEENFVGVPGKLEEIERERKAKEKKMTPEEKEAHRKEQEEHEKQKKEEERIAEEQRKEENRKRIAEEEAERKAQEEQQHIQDLKENNEKATTAFPIVENDPNPSAVNQTMYAYFDKFAERMGIDQSKLNAQSIIQAASIAYINENTREIVENNPNDEPFLKEMTAIYNQISRITYAAYIEKCINEHRPIDLNVPSNEVSDLMGVTMYAMYPTVVNGEKKDMVRLGAILKVINGTITTYDFDTRKAAIELANLAYQDKDVSFFTADAEARYESFTTQKRSSDSIVEETASIVNSYAQYKENRVDPKINSEKLTYSYRTAFKEGEMRKKAMDAAYALERRVETRYKSWLARFFRRSSYTKQKEELARVKNILEIPQDQRVADHIKAHRIADAFADANYKMNNIQRKHERAAQVGNDAKKYITQLLEKNVGKENITHITEKEFNDEVHRRFIKFQEMTPAAIEAQKLYEEEQRRQEELERERRDEEAKIFKALEEERLRKEAEEKMNPAQDAEENLKEEEPVEEEEPEPLITEEEYAKKVYEAKEKLFNDKIKVITTNRDASERLRKSKEDERNNSIKKNREIFANMQKKANDLREANDELNSQISFLQTQIAEISKKLSERATENTNLEEQAEAEAKKKSSFFSKLGSAFTSQKTKDAEQKQEAEKEAMRVESKNAVKSTKELLDGFTEELGNYLAQVQNNTQEADKLDKDKWIYENRATRLQSEISNVELDAAKEVKQYQRILDNLMQNKEKIIESGEGLNFDESLFKKNLMEALEAERKAKTESANKANNGEANVDENEKETKERVSVNIDESNKNAPIEPKKEKISKEQPSLQK